MPEATQQPAAPAAPPTVTATTPPAPPVEKRDSFLADILGTLHADIVDGKVTALDPSKLPKTTNAPFTPSTQTLAEIIASAPTTTATPTSTPPVAPVPAAATPAPVAPPPEPPAPPKVKPSRVDELAARIAELETRKAAAIPEPPPAPAPTPPPADDAAFIATLDPEQKDEIEFAEWAEKKHPELKGRKADTIAFYKKLDEWVEKNPDKSESEEFDTFLKENRPKYGEAQRRKLEREMIEDRATTRAREEITKEFGGEMEALKREQHRIAVEPQVNQAVAAFKETLTNATGLPAELKPFPKELAAVIAEKGRAVAMEQFPVETPIFQSAETLASEFLNISSGLKPFDPNTRAHVNLAKFLDDQAGVLKKAPENVRVQNGRIFIGRGEFAAEMQKDPAAAQQKYWTFTDGQVLDMISLEAVRTANQKLRDLEKAGFVRQSKAPAAPVPAAAPPATPPPAASNGNPPRAGATITPGAASAAPNSHSNASFVEALFPGALKTIPQS